MNLDQRSLRGGGRPQRVTTKKLYSDLGRASESVYCNEMTGVSGQGSGTYSCFREVEVYTDPLIQADINDLLPSWGGHYSGSLKQISP